MRIGVLISGGGTNLQAIIDALNTHVIKKSKIQVVISNKKDAHGLTRAKNHNIEAIYVNDKDYNSREEYDQEIVAILKERGVNLVVLAGYLKWITKFFVDSFPYRIINIHPSILPAFPGLNAIDKAYDYGVKISGVTVHFVDKTKDGGPIIAQETVELEKMTKEEFEDAIHKTEHKILPMVIENIRSKSLKVVGRKIYFD